MRSRANANAGAIGQSKRLCENATTNRFVARADADADAHTLPCNRLSSPQKCETDERKDKIRLPLSCEIIADHNVVLLKTVALL